MPRSYDNIAQRSNDQSVKQSKLVLLSSEVTSPLNFHKGLGFSNCVESRKLCLQISEYKQSPD